MPITTDVIVCGLNRSLTFTHGSIDRQILQPLQNSRLFDMSVNLFLIAPEGHEIANPRSAEAGQIERHLPPAWEGIPSRTLPMADLLRQTGSLKRELQKRPDRWSDNWASLTNILVFLEALRTSFDELMATKKSGVVVFCRPDLVIEGRLRIKALVMATYLLAKVGINAVFVPEWAHYKGHNDRFAVMSLPAAEAYFRRIERIVDLLKPGQPFHSETFLKLALADQFVFPVIKTPMLRVRIGGRRDGEDERLIERLAWHRRLGFWRSRVKRWAVKAKHALINRRR